jgi:hypothetical protein
MYGNMNELRCVMCVQNAVFIPCVVCFVFSVSVACCSESVETGLVVCWCVEAVVVCGVVVALTDPGLRTVTGAVQYPVVPRTS